MTFPFPAASFQAAQLSYQTSSAQESSTATNTFSSLSVGSASANRYVIVGTVGRTGSTGTTITSVTIGGITATSIASLVVAGSGSGENFASIHIALVPTGTTATVVVTTSTTLARCAVVVWTATGLKNSGAATASGTSSAAPLTATFNVGGGGFAVGVGFTQSATSSTAGVLTENIDSTIAPSATNTYTGASLAFSATQSITPTFTWSSSTAPVGAFASFR